MSTQSTVFASSAAFILLCWPIDAARSLDYSLNGKNERVMTAHATV